MMNDIVKYTRGKNVILIFQWLGCIVDNHDLSKDHKEYEIRYVINIFLINGSTLASDIIHELNF